MRRVEWNRIAADSDSTRKRDTNPFLAKQDILFTYGTYFRNNHYPIGGSTSFVLPPSSFFSLMSKRKADEISSDPTTIDGDSSRARRGAAAIDHIAAADSTTSTAPPATNNTGTGATAAEEAENKPTRRGRMAAPAEMRIEQKEAMTRLATMVRQVEGWGAVSVASIPPVRSTDLSFFFFFFAFFFFVFSFQSSHGVDCPSWYGFKNSAFVAKRTAAIGPGR